MAAVGHLSTFATAARLALGLASVQEWHLVLQSPVCARFVFPRHSPSGGSTANFPVASPLGTPPYAAIHSADSVLLKFSKT